jgi:hypothetical protein
MKKNIREKGIPVATTSEFSYKYNTHQIRIVSRSVALKTSVNEKFYILPIYGSHTHTPMDRIGSVNNRFVVAGGGLPRAGG